MVFVVIVAGILCGGELRGSDGMPRGCHEMPYERYEAEAGRRGGGAVLRTCPDFDVGVTASEASGRAYVGLGAVGSSVEWDLRGSGRGVTMRFTLPDNAAGTGVVGSLEVSVNGVPVATVNLGSYWAWTYFVTSDPQNAPGGTRPRMRFDEIHWKLPVEAGSGDVLRVRKVAGDAWEYGVDFVEVEPVPDELAQPTGFISVGEYGARGDDELSDSAAFDSAWQAAKNRGTGLYIPKGKFILDRRWNLGDSSGLKIQGAGIWHTELFFSKKAVGAGGLLAGKNTTAIEISHFYMNSALNERHIVAGQVSDYKALTGPFGSGSKIHDLWIAHFETGAWIADYTSPVKATSGLEFFRNRVRGTYADGINLSQGTHSSTVSQCDFRDNGDDAMAVWPSNVAGAPQGHHNTFHNNTVEFTYRAGGVGIFGGYGHSIHHNIIKDGVESAGIRFTEDFGGYHFESNTGIIVSENTLIAKGTGADLWNNPLGAVEIRGAGIRSLFFSGNEILDSPRHAVRLDGGFDLHFTDTTIRNTGLDNRTNPGGAAIYESGSGGSASFVGLALSGVASDPAILQLNPAYQLTVQQRVPVASVSALTVREGGTASFTVRLDAEPTGPVRVAVTVTAGDPDITIQSGAVLDFTPSDWAVGKTVTLAAAEDDDQTNGTATISLTAPGYSQTTVSVSEIDNDINHAPDAVNDVAETVENGGIEIDVLANDADVDGDPLGISALGPAAHGSLSHDGIRVSYIPRAGFSGKDHFTYTISDGRGGFATASVEVTVRDILEATPYEMEIRFDGYTGMETLHDFPVLVRIGPSCDGFSYGLFAAADGSDLRFRDADGNELRYEIELWNPDGDSLVWVRVPRLASGSSIWAAWGSPAHAARPAYCADGSVWSGGFAAVIHASESEGTRNDSSPNGRHGVPVGVPVAAAGQIGGGVSFNGAGDGLRLPPTFGVFNGSKEFSVEFWFHARTVAVDSVWQTSPVIFQTRGERQMMITFGDGQPGNALGIRLNQAGWATPAAAGGIAVGRWYHFACTYSPTGTNNWKIYLDGIPAAQGTRTGTIAAETSLSDLIGGSDEPNTSRWFNGLIDEFRISDVAWSADWVRAAHDNARSPTSFGVSAEVRESELRYAFASAASSGGLVTGSADGQYPAGAAVTVVADPLAHFRFSHWNGDFPGELEQANPLTLTMNRNRSVTAVFEPVLTTNGVPVAWLAAHGIPGDFEAASLTDFDGDGQNARQEFFAGTDPNDPSSALRANLIPSGSGNFTLTWPAVEGKTYRVEFTTDLRLPWDTIAAGLPATPPANSRTEFLPVGGGFFRVSVEEP